MITSCREGETFTWRDGLRHLLRGAREGIRGGAGPDDSSSDDEGGSAAGTGEGGSGLRAAWSTTPPE
eukprot:2469837-Alexandrium_andersonii.AAC.1